MCGPMHQHCVCSLNTTLLGRGFSVTKALNWFPHADLYLTSLLAMQKLCIINPFRETLTGDGSYKVEAHSMGLSPTWNRSCRMLRCVRDGRRMMVHMIRFCPSQWYFLPLGISFPLGLEMTKRKDWEGRRIWVVINWQWQCFLDSMIAWIPH